MSIELSEQEQLRRQSLAALRELGIDPYPAARYEVTATAREIADNYDEARGNYQDIRIAGRIMSRRIMGSASFFELQDHTGRIQVYIRRDDVCPEGDPTLYNTVFKKLLDIGDFIGVEGFAFHTNTGELSVHCRKFTVLSKSIRPLPVVKAKDGQTFDAFTDPEVRYRQRYVDLVVNPQVRDVFVRRAKIVATMRQFFNERGYVEVETPILQPIPGGASARPFITHHNALDIDQYLRIASELYLKKLIVGGFDGVYEFGKNFRNEGMDRTHNPEFTVMEIYVAYKDYLWMMEFTEQMLERVAVAVNGTTELTLDELPVAVHTARSGEAVVGYAVETASKNGFSGMIRMVVGFDATGRVLNVNVLEQNETPGLGTKMADEGNPLFASFEGRNPGEMKLAVKKDGGDVDALTAATISSRAYVDAMARAYAAYKQIAEGVAPAASDTASGATATGGDAAAAADSAAGATAQTGDNAQKGGDNE